MASLGTLAVNIVARTEKFSRGISKSMALTQRFNVAMAGMGVGATAVAGTFVKMAHSHDQLQKSMNASLAIMGKVSDEMRRKMTDAALEVSRSTRFAADEAAKAYFYLASAGLDAQQSLAAMPKVAAFAQAGNFDLALATDLATDAQSALGMTSKDEQKNLKGLARVTDALIKANTLANASAEQFSVALTNKAGAALRLVNKDIEEGLAVLAAYADQGTKAEEAGTALGIIMRDLQTKAIKNAEAFAENRIAVFDSAGAMRNMADILEDIENRLAGMSDMQKKATLLNIGFSDKSVAYIQTLIGMSEKIRQYEKDLRSAGGITEEVASKQMTAMEKATAKLRSSFERLSNSIGPAFDGIATNVEKAMGPLEKMIALMTIGASGASSGFTFEAGGAGRPVDKHTRGLMENYLRGTGKTKGVDAFLGMFGAAMGRKSAKPTKPPVGIPDTPGPAGSSWVSPFGFNSQYQFIRRPETAKTAKAFNFQTSYLKNAFDQDRMRGLGSNRFDNPAFRSSNTALEYGTREAATAARKRPEDNPIAKNTKSSADSLKEAVAILKRVDIGAKGRNYVMRPAMLAGGA